MNTLLELKQIKLHYKNYNTSVEVIKGIDLKIHSGEKVAVVGKSGSGKTSLIMLIGGLEKPSSGEIIFDQQLISSFSEDQLADIRKQKIGIVVSTRIVRTLELVQQRHSNHDSCVAALPKGRGVNLTIAVHIKH